MSDMRTTKKHYKFIPTFSAHIARYNFAMLYGYDKDVLDVGSREGFGAHLMSYGAKTVTLCDINQTYLERADRYYRWFCPVSYIQADLEKGFPAGEWDCMTAFEVIEHVEDASFLVKNMAEHLRPGGVLVFSVPHMVENHEHKSLFDAERIRKVVGEYLDIEELFEQDSYPFGKGELYKGLKCHVGVARKRMVQ
jgi:2-polyprenyl-3-methyl-5-hydroxy-6-metoxy-1,4-benzoquinol methylase